MFDTLDDLGAAIGKVAASEAPLDVVALREQIERLELVWLRAVRDAEKAGTWEAEGFASSAAWLRERCRLTGPDASGAVKLGRTLEAMPAVAEAWERGAITKRHAEVLSIARTPHRAEIFSTLDEEFADHAPNLTVNELRTVVRHVCDAIDGDGGAGHDAQQLGRRSLSINELLDGMHDVRGTFDPETALVVNATIEAVMALDREAGDPRTLGQRRVDALAEACRIAMAHLGTDSTHNPPHVTVVVDLADVEARDGGDLAATVRSEASRGPLSRSTLERLTCDCRISRAITDGPSEILDLGRSVRTVTAAQWRALVTRDGGCVVPGCTCPPGWCEAHHKDWWDRDRGETNIDDLELRCRRHHREEHATSRPPPRGG